MIFDLEAYGGSSFSSSSSSSSSSSNRDSERQREKEAKAAKEAAEKAEKERKKQEKAAQESAAKADAAKADAVRAEEAEAEKIKQANLLKKEQDEKDIATIQKQLGVSREDAVKAYNQVKVYEEQIKGQLSSSFKVGENSQAKIMSDVYGTDANYVLNSKKSAVNATIGEKEKSDYKHFEQRAEANKKADNTTYGYAINNATAIKMKESEAVFHSNKDGVSEEKYVFLNLNGSSSEAVYDGKSIAWLKRGRTNGKVDPEASKQLTPIMEPKIKGTFNYTDASISKWEHAKDDVFDYIIKGSTRDSDRGLTSVIKRAAGKDN